MKRHIFSSFLLLALLLLLAACTGTPSLPPATTTPPVQPTSVPATIPATSFLARPSPSLLRVMSFNPYWDAIFPDGDPQNNTGHLYDRADAFRRIVGATEPDVLCLQEINPVRDPSQVASILDQVLPLERGEMWQATSGQDNVIASRYPLTLADEWLAYSGTLTPLGHATALVDLPGSSPDLYVLCAHFKSAGGEENIVRRQQHADQIISLLADARTLGGQVDLPAGTALLVLGDFNVYDTDPHRHLTTLLTGDIVDEERYGPDSAPDWDNTSLADALPPHNSTGRQNWTWRDDTQEFNPGILDRILYSDSILALEHAFVLNTMALTAAELAAANLEAADVTLDADRGIYDHLPLVVDFSLKK